VSDPTPRGTVRLTAVEQGGTDRPIEKPLPANLFVRPAAGAHISPETEAFLAFEPAVAYDDLKFVLRTTGFEGVEGLEAVEFEAAAPVPAAPIVIAPPVARPVLEVKPTSVPIAVYEPMEFLDFDDEEDGVHSEAVVEPEPEPDPPVLTEAFAIPLPKAAAPSVPKMIQGVGPLALPDLAAEIPALTLTTVRPRLLRGPNPFAPKTVAAPTPVAAPVEAPKPVKATPGVAKPPQPAVRPAATQPNVVQRPAAAAAAVAAPAIKAEPAVRPEPKPSPADKDRRPAAKPPAPAPAAPARPVRDRGNALPVEEVVEPPAPAPKPKMVPIRKPEPLAPAVAEPAAAKHEVPMLGLEPEKSNPMAKFGMIVGVLVVLAGGGYFALSGGKSAASATTQEAPDIASPMAIGGGGWATTWGSESPVNQGKQISIYRPSMATPDYRFEFRGQIERKAMGWIFRAKDPKNYYVMKLEALKQGANPLVALVKYAVINGKETTRTQVMLPFPVTLGTIYQVRLDVKGNKFSTYVQDKLVDYWADDRIKVGGTGFYTETGERSQIKASQVSYLH
jgi:hypothetical protein